MFDVGRLLLGFRQKRFARDAVRALMNGYGAVRVDQPELRGRDLYREVLLRVESAAAADVDDLLTRAEHSVDEWTARGREELGFRELVHYVVVANYAALERTGAIVSFEKIVRSMVPADI